MLGFSSFLQSHWASCGHLGIALKAGIQCPFWETFQGTAPFRITQPVSSARTAPCIRLFKTLAFLPVMNLAEQTDALFRAIGHAVVRFQQVEQWLAEELALLLSMREREDQYLVSAAMSFKQKVDLLVEIFPRRSERHSKLPRVDVKEVKKALYAAEEYRNRVVHSFYGVECGEDSTRWLRMKGSLRGRAGFSLNSIEANVDIFEECNDALAIIREWSLRDPEIIRTATATLTKYMQSGSV